MVAAAEVAADLAVGRAGVLARQIHGHHAGVGQGAGAAVGLERLGTDLEKLADSPFDVGRAMECAVWRIVSRSAALARFKSSRLPVSTAWAITVCKAPSSSRMLARRCSAI